MTKNIIHFHLIDVIFTILLLLVFLNTAICVFQKLARYILIQADDTPGGSSPNGAVVLELAEVRVLQSVFSGCPLTGTKFSAPVAGTDHAGITAWPDCALQCGGRNI